MNAKHLKKENAVPIFLKKKKKEGKEGARELQMCQLSFNFRKTVGKEIIKSTIFKHPDFIFFF